MNGKGSANKILIGFIITVFAGLTLGATAWNFNAVASIPEKYVLKLDNSEEHQEINKKLDKIYDLILKLHTHGEDGHESMQVQEGRK